MNFIAHWSIRTKLTAWYVSVLLVLLLIFASIIFFFQYAMLTRQIVHDEMQEIVTVEGLLYFDASGHLQLRQDYYSRPQSHLLVDRLMEVLDLQDNVLYRSHSLEEQSLGGPLLRAEGDGSSNERIVRLKDGSHILVISHIHGMDGSDVVIRLGYSLRPLRERMLQFLYLLATSLFLMIFLAGLTGQWIARKAMSPIGIMAKHAAGITAHNLHDRLQITNSQDELGALASTFNHLLERLEQSFQQLQRFTADAAHELRTPLASLRTVGEVTLGEERSKEQYQEAISSILEETQRLNQTIDSLLLLTRAEAGNALEANENVTLSPLLLEVVQTLSVLAEEKEIQISIENHTSSDAEIFGERTLLRIALMNALHNAIKFSPHGGKIDVRTQTELSFVVVSVTDQGPGILEEEFEAVFQRFYRGRGISSNEGSGLGLSIVKLIVNRLGGTASFAPGQATGAALILRLPLSSIEADD